MPEPTFEDASSPSSNELVEAAARAAATAERNRTFATLAQAGAHVVLLRGPELIVEFMHFSLIGAATHSFIGKPVRELLKHNRHYVEVLERVYATGMPAKGLEAPLQRRLDGKIAESHWNYAAVPTRGADGAIDGVMAVVVDAAEQVRARKAVARARDALQQAESRMRLAVDAAAVGIWEFDFLLERVSLDRRCAAILAAPGLGEHPTPETVLARVHPEDRERVEAALLQACDPGGDGELAIEFRLSGEAARFVAARGRTTFDVTGDPVICSGTMVDITQGKLAELERERLLEREQALRAEAESASRAKDEFLAMLGHELRNPLSPIATAIELMRIHAPDVLAKERAVIERQVNHLRRLVDDLLDVSRITRGRIELRKRAFDAGQVIGAAIEMVSPLLEKGQHRLHTAIDPGLFVEADEHRLGQVFVNLLANAAKYTQPGGRIEVTGRRDGDAIEVRVRDDGAGIAPELLARIFDIFVQGSRTLDRAQGGLGIGLSVARALVELHGGTLTAASEGHGRGSEFVVRLPAAHARSESEPVAAAPERAASRTRGRVLVVDDNQDAADVLAEGLSDAGYVTDVAYDGPSALAAAERARHDVALLDLGLPVMDGYELARQLRARNSPAALVALTGYGQALDRSKTGAAGFIQHLVKPVPLPQILEAIEAALAGAENVEVR